MQELTKQLKEKLSEIEFTSVVFIDHIVKNYLKGIEQLKDHDTTREKEKELAEKHAAECKQAWDNLLIVINNRR